jgi:hypothetical protein
MVAEYGHFPPDWEKISDTPIEYMKKIGSYELRATETEGFCEKCGEKGLGFSFKTIDSRGDYIGRSGAYWCPKCGEGMSPEDYENFVKSELITPEM